MIYCLREVDANSNVSNLIEVYLLNNCIDQMEPRRMSVNKSAANANECVEGRLLVNANRITESESR